MHALARSFHGTVRRSSSLLASTAGGWTLRWDVGRTSLAETATVIGECTSRTPNARTRNAL
eukprot:13388763-Alexandrium_andersonii.AAC.1